MKCVPVCSGYIPSWQERKSRLDDIPQKDLDPRFRDHNYRYINYNCILDLILTKFMYVLC